MITGLEKDFSNELGDAIEKSKEEGDDKDKAYKTFKETSYPYHEQKAYDCNMYYIEELLEKQSVLYQDALPPREKDLNGEQCINCIKEYKQKVGQEQLGETCQCMRKSEIYAVYSPNRCYPEYVISYTVERE